MLGVKESASEEEIRARWVELTKQYHPDRGEDLSSNERIREINEAYQVLKHSSTRVEYDLKRTYGQKKRKSYSKRVGIPAGILVIAIIIGIIYFMNSQNGTNGTGQTGPKSPITQSPDDLRTNRPSDSVEQKPLAASTLAASAQQRIAASSHQPIAASTHPRTAASIPKPIDVKIAHLQVTKKNQTNQKDQTDQRNQIDQKNQIDSTTQPLKGTVDLPTPAATISAARNVELAVQQPRRRHGSADATDTQPQRPRDASDPMDSTTSRPIGPTGLNPPSLLGTEDEVRKFFNDYVERYNRMDLEGLFSLFSSGAIQNKKDGLERIRKIYSNFFNQGQEVRYRVQDMQIEIYQNTVEVKARYEINQILKMGEKMGWKGNVHWVLGKENGAFKILSLDYQHQQIY